jgi:peptidyl-prolyl cis-trans isomerase B (cyclophilin B)
MNITLRSTLLTLLCALSPALAQGGTEKPKDPPAKAQGEKPKDDKDKADKPKVDPLTESDPFIQALDAFAKKVDKKGDDWKTHLPEPPKQKFALPRTYFWNLSTNKGDLKIELFPESAPMHVTSVIYLTRLGYYEGIIFHRVINGFMAQGGDPTGTGSGGPGYLMDTEWDGKHTHDKAGVLSTANTGRPKSEGSQFFLTFGPTTMLDGKYTIYGQVVDGMDTLKALEACGKPRDPAPPTERLEIKRAWITVTEHKGDLKDETKGEEKKGEKKEEKKGEGK